VASSPQPTLSSARIVHFATHGYFADENSSSGGSISESATSGDGGWRSYAETLTERSVRSPSMRNGLVLAGVNLGSKIDTQHFRIEKGIITAQEISDLDLSGVELAVLSACDSGLGKIEPGEGVFGLQRSLMMAGVRRVLASLWKVSDTATSDPKGGPHRPFL
jgi:CHAT domain-containing protein